MNTEQSIKESNGYDYILLKLVKCINEKYLRHKQEVFNNLLTEFKQNQEQRPLKGINGFSVAFFVNAIKDIKQRKAEMIKRLIGNVSLNVGINNSELITLRRLIKNSDIIKPSLNKKHGLVKMPNVLNNNNSETEITQEVKYMFRLCPKTLFYEWA